MKIEVYDRFFGEDAEYFDARVEQQKQEEWLRTAIPKTIPAHVVTMFSRPEGVVDYSNQQLVERAKLTIWRQTQNKVRVCVRLGGRHQTKGRAQGTLSKATTLGLVVYQAFLDAGVRYSPKTGKEESARWQMFQGAQCLPTTTAVLEVLWSILGEEAHTAVVINPWED
ncbi:MAG: hypothetical protein JKY94_17355 [Rhodobacteraceae bacterium]|nr:hypothetical protein [Paracoccaceae bacterium]